MLKLPESSVNPMVITRKTPKKLKPIKKIKIKSLKFTNPYLQDPEKYKEFLKRNVESSSAIERD